MGHGTVARRTPGVMWPERDPCVRWVARGVPCWRRHVPPVRALGRVLWGACGLLGVVNSVPGLPPEALCEARAGCGLVEDEDKGEEGREREDGCQWHEQRPEQAEETAARQGHGGRGRCATWGLT